MPFQVGLMHPPWSCSDDTKLFGKCVHSVTSNWYYTSIYKKIELRAKEKGLKIESLSLHQIPSKKLM